MQGTLTTSSLLSIIGIQIAKTNTSFLEVLSSFSQYGPFFGNCSIFRRLSYP